MSDVLHILLVDDNPDDRELARRAVASGFPDACFVEVGTAAQFEAALETRFDCALTDFRLGWSDGLAVLRRLKEIYPERPVIMFTNTGSEEVCAQGMKSGLSDYIVKRREEFPKLPAAVQTALDLNAARQAVRERDARVQDLLERERAARSDAERANRLKDEFLATVSHELRTPLGAVLGWAQLLQLQRLPRDEELKAFDIIYRNARTQTKLIDDLLDMSRILSGTMRVDLGPVDILDAVHAALEAVQPSAARKSISLSTRLEPVPPPVRGDVARLQQVIINLLDNAIKFTPVNGMVQIVVERAGSSLQIVVSDSGVGIEADFLPDIFDRFSQGDTGPTRRHGGLGIGLSVARSLVEMHGGSIEAFSDGPGHGARFLVSLPVAVMRERDMLDFEERPDHADYERLRGLKILVVDDDADTRALIERVLTVYGAQVASAASAGQALALLSQDRQDVLLSDIGMPDEDGYALISRIRSMDGPNQTLAAASVTAFARSEDRERALLAGFDSHLVKPVEPGELVAVVLSLSKRRAADA